MPVPDSKLDPCRQCMFSQQMHMEHPADVHSNLAFQVAGKDVVMHPIIRILAADNFSEPENAQHRAHK